MKGRFKCFGLLLVCSIMLGLSLNASSDASAVDWNVNLKPVKTLDSGGYKCGYRRSDQSAVTEVGSTCRIPQLSNGEPLTISRYIDYLVSNNSFDVDKEHYYLLKFFLRVDLETNVPLSSFYNFPVSDGAQFTVQDVDVKVVGNDTYSYWRLGGGSSSVYSVDIYPNQFVEYDVLLKPRNSGNYQIKLSKSGSHLFTFPTVSAVDLPAIYVGFYAQIEEFEIDNSLSDMNEKDEQDRDDLESQSTSIDSSAGSSSSSAESTGTTLLSAFSGFVTAITSANPSNCNLNMDLGNLDLGVVNLCSLSPPQPIPTIASIFLILFCVPLSISTARKVISLFRSFQ